MDVERNRRQALLSWLFVAVLVALCAALGILQYRWIGEASRAEGDRMRAGLETRLQRLSRDFNTEIAAACSALTPAELDLDYVRAVVLPDLLQRNIGPDYQVEVIARESPSTVIYRSGGEGAAPIGAHADASVGLFSIDQFRFRGGTARGGGRGGGRGRPAP